MPRSNGRRGRLIAEAAIVATAALSAFAVARAWLVMPARTGLPTPPPLAAAPPKAVAGFSQGVVEDAFLIAFVEPVPGHAVVSPFGLRQLPWEENGRLHEGVDISADAGVPVRVAAEGVVVVAGEGGGYGRYVVVRHAVGLRTFYAHLGRIGAGVKPGVAVAAGDAVGVVGNTGSSTGPHLHFEIRDAANHPLDPAMFLGRAFAEKGDLPLDKAKRYSGRVRIAYVSNIPTSKQALMDARADKPITIRRSSVIEDMAAADRNLDGQAKAAAKSEKIDGLKGLSIGPDGRPRAQLSL